MNLFNGDKGFFRNLWGTAASIIAFLAILSMMPGVFDGKIYTYEIASFGGPLNLTLRVDSLGYLFSIVSSSMWVLVNIYTIGYMEHEHDKQRFFAFFAFSLLAAFGIAYAENLFAFFLFYEALSIFTYPLVIHAGTKEALKAGSKYMIYTLGGGGLLLIGIIITYFVTGTLTLSEPGIFSVNDGAGLLQALFVMFIIGTGVKAGVMPFHHWLPAAMVAPTPVSTLLHAVAVVKAGAFGVLRVIYSVFGVDVMAELGLGTALALVGAFTVITASIIAIRQDNLKRRLAYSTISQLSYIVMGGAIGASVGVGAPLAAIGAMAHIANHAFTKGTLFMCAGIIAEETGKKNISEMNGMGRRLPLTMAAFTIAAFGMIGLPPLAGFVTKWTLGIGAGEAGAPIFMAVLVGSSILNAIYFLPICYRVFFMKPETEIEAKALKRPRNKPETTYMMLVPIMTTVVVTFILGIFASVPGLPMSVAEVAATFFLGG